MYKTKTGLDGGSVRLRGGFDCTRAFGRVLGADHNKQLFKLDFNATPPPPLRPNPITSILNGCKELVPVYRGELRRDLFSASLSK